MRGSWKLGEFAGIGVFVHWTFLLLIAWLLGAFLMSGQGILTAMEGIALVVAVFACIVLHEFGHALTARHFGVTTRDITLLPIGGLARLSRIPEDPRQELLIAVAGPGVNVVIAAGLWMILAIFGLAAGMVNLQLAAGHFLANLMWINIFLVAFNLLPAFPMDGGRVLRALLAFRLPYLQATQIAARVGQSMAILFAVVGLFYNFWLILIGLFIFLGAEGESSLIELRARLRGVPIREAMLTRFTTASPDDTLEDLMAHLVPGAPPAIAVVEDGKVLGMMSRDEVLCDLVAGHADALVRDRMSPNCPCLGEDATLEESYQQMQSSDCPAVPVVEHGSLLGLVTMQSILDWLAINSALSGGRRRHPNDLREPAPSSDRTREHIGV